MGIASPIGIGKDEVARALFAGTRGLVPRTDLIAGRMVHVGQVSVALPQVPTRLEYLECRNNRLVLAALAEIADLVEKAVHRLGSDRIAVVMGTGTSGIAEGEAAYESVRRTGIWPSDFHYRKQEPGNLAEFVASALRVSGPAYTVATACSSSGKAFGSARRLIAAGRADAAVVGGADTLCRMTVGGFAALEAMSSGLCNPFSRNRDGINIGEAAAVFLLTQEPAPIRLVGVGESSDAYHVSGPDPEARGAVLAMRAALDDAGLAPRDIAYVNLHGTGTALNDSAEGKAVNELFGTETPCSSTKALTGHTLGTAAACEAAFLWLTLNPQYNPEGYLPPHVWDGEADPSIPPLALVAAGTRFLNKMNSAALLSNSFGFGGSDVALVLSRGTLT
jgi:3-oxoacyl-[acyl-carrier-protein] synthase-1